MSVYKCMKCLRSGDVRFVEHGDDDMPLCKSCFRDIKQEFDNRMEEDNE